FDRRPGGMPRPAADLETIPHALGVRPAGVDIPPGRRSKFEPLIVKLTPNTADVAAVAEAAAGHGADAVSLINTLRAMPMQGDPPQPWLGARTGGLSGAAVRQVALAQIAAVAARVDVPVVGMGGVETAEHARQVLAAGATVVAVGTASFRDPAAGSRIARELTRSAQIAG
ncbi:MAG TPA: HisA/HisF-related TIM barrel protein, partial [Baekduia sp.]|nr:HisA/HisF-related TIM barrel protein [Baekduia sp.]